MSSFPTNLRPLADFAAMAHQLGMIEPRGLIEWADALILESDAPPEWLMDLSMPSRDDPRAIESALRRVPGARDLTETFRLIGALVLRDWSAGRLTIDDVSRIGRHVRYESFSHSLDYVNPHPLAYWSRAIEYELDMLAAAVSTEERVRAAIDRELSAFAESLALLPEWARPPAAVEGRDG